MKKTVMALALVIGGGVSTGVFAADFFRGTYSAYPTGGEPPAGLEGAECALLAEAVRLGVSQNVVGGFACSEVNNLVQVATCHSGGSRAAGVACSSDADLNTTEIELPAGCEDTTGNSTEPSYKAFTLSSAGGVMSEAPLSGRCDEDTLGGIKWIQ